MYNWQYENWSNFVYNEDVISNNSLKFAELSGEIFGIFKTFNSAEQQNEILDIMISEAVETSKIEGEMLSREDVRSSFLKKLGITTTIKNIKDKRVENVVLLMLEVRNSFRTKLSEKLIKHWHSILFSNSKYINSGVYRASEEAMQIVSGAIGKEKVHFEAPPSIQVPQEMKHFVKWYNSFKPKDNIQKIIIKAAITHLYFESIHPFEDGNGRIGRALIEKCLAESLNRQLILSISTAIESDKKNYYVELNNASKTLEINDWLIYFAKLLIKAQQHAIDAIRLSIRKKHFFEMYKNLLNDRQTKVLKKIFDKGAEDFEGGITAKKYISITKTTKTTATRDLQELVKHKILLRKGNGRSTHDILNV